MQTEISSSVLKVALNKLLSVVDKKSVRPILNYTLISIKNNSVEVSASDLEVSSKIIVEAKSNEEYQFCVNAKNLFEILRELPDTNIILSLSDDKKTLNLSCLDIHYSLLIYKSDEYPHLFFENKKENISLKSNLLLEVLNKTSYAISNDETRLYLNGIFLQSLDSKLRAVATDGHRLSLLDTEIDKSINNLIDGIIIPKKGISELKKIAETNPESLVNISFDDSFMYVNNADKYFLAIRLIAREYPKYQAVIPSKTSYKLTTDRNLFLNAVKRIKIMSNEKSHGVRFIIKGNELTLTANHHSLGNAEEKINVDYNGTDMEIGFNAKYLVDTIASFSDDEITLELNNELSPVLVKSKNIPHFLGIIMPLRL
ncbi:MAG: DNA polymerase III subunit beta [Bdellovibrionales bacterium]|jgi:DNA polymerase III subunit beta|nr:DNA polymerase III subunit beta [Bdellovibrionales bacterium]